MVGLPVIIIEDDPDPQLLYPHEPIANPMLSPTVGLSLYVCFRVFTGSIDKTDLALMPNRPYLSGGIGLATKTKELLLQTREVISESLT